MRWVTVVGARPQLVKAAVLARAVARWNAGAGERIEWRLVHTGQHYDAPMAGDLVAELGLAPPDVALGVGSGPHGWQTGRMLEALEAALPRLAPDLVVVVGDTNSTLAGALAAAKLGLPVAHVEAGCRSFVRTSPEEVNRVVADHLADVLLAPTPAALARLAAEGLGARAVRTGDVAYDAVLAARPLIAASDAPARLGLAAGRYALATVHRAETVDVPSRLAGVLAALDAVGRGGLSVVFPVHPRTARRLADRVPAWHPAAAIRVVGPVGHADLLRLARDARLVLTDSGGVQREAFFLGTPCVTLRDETEWRETVEAGGNVLAGADPERIAAAVAAWERRRAGGVLDFAAAAPRWFGDGRAADRIVAELAARTGGARRAAAAGAPA